MSIDFIFHFLVISNAFNILVDAEEKKLMFFSFSKNKSIVPSSFSVLCWKDHINIKYPD